MKKIEAIIVDDEPAVQENLRNLLTYNFEQIKVVACASSGKEAVQLVHRHKPEALFLDIQMPQLDGFGVLEQVLPQYPNLAVVFVTAYDHYAIQAIKAKAIDYVVKPIRINELRNAIAGIEEHLGCAKSSSTGGDVAFPILAVPFQQGIEIVNTRSLLYLQADGSYTEFHLQDGRKLLISKSLATIEKMISPSFYRIHKSCIVNLHHMVRFLSNDSAVVLTNNVRLPVAIRRAAEFREVVTQYFKALE